MPEAWTTREAITAARQRFESAIPGWREPVVYGVGRLLATGVEFFRINTTEHRLPAVILARDR